MGISTSWKPGERVVTWDRDDGAPLGPQLYSLILSYPVARRFTYER
jgi:hypothetical protein